MGLLAHKRKDVRDRAMRIHQQNKSRKLYRSVNTTTRHHSNNPVLSIGGNEIAKSRR